VKCDVGAISTGEEWKIEEVEESKGLRVEEGKREVETGWERPARVWRTWQSL